MELKMVDERSIEMSDIYWENSALDGLQSLLDEHRIMKKYEGAMKKEQSYNNKPPEPSNDTGCKEKSLFEMQHIHWDKPMLEGLQSLFDEHRKRKKV